MLVVSKNTYIVFLLLVFTAVATIERTINTFRQNDERGKIYFRNSFGLLVSSYLMCVVSSLVELLLFKEVLVFQVTLAGSFLFLSGMSLRNSAIRRLGKQWSVHIDLRKTEEIVRRGPYRYIRHPYYLAVLLELLGFCLMTNSYFSMALVLSAQVPLLVVRVHYEEKALTRKFGRAYLWYKCKLGSLPF